jgi:hypothetical protein
LDQTGLLFEGESELRLLLHTATRKAHRVHRNDRPFEEDERDASTFEDEPDQRYASTFEDQRVLVILRNTWNNAAFRNTHFFPYLVKNNTRLMKGSCSLKKLAGGILLLFAIAACTVRTTAQTIYTLAGTGTAAYTGDGGPATAAELDNPEGVAIDGSGNVYIADINNSVIRKIDVTGIISTFAGTGAFSFGGDGGPATSADLNSPRGVTVDWSGNVYIAEFLNRRVRKVNSSGIISTFAGNGTYAYSGDGGPATAAGMSTPFSTAIDGAGNIYIADPGLNVIRVVNTSGVISTFAGNGMASYSGDGMAATATALGHPNGVAADGLGNVYIADAGNNRVRKVNPSGIISTIAGNGTAGYYGDGGAATAAAMNEPIGLAIDGHGDIYIVEYINNIIRKVSAAGIISTFAGNGIGGFAGDGGPATAAELLYPTGVAVHSSGNVYIADRANNRIRVVVPPPSIPRFDGGSSQSLTVCENSGPTPINSLLTVTDASVWLTETYSVITPPTYGIITAGSTVMSGTSVSPTGWAYAPVAGYSGADAFIIQVSNGTYTAGTMISVTVNPLPAPGVITGTDTICPGDTAMLTSTAAGGVWSSYNTSIATAGSTGIVTGGASGTDTIYYTVTNSCGTARAKQVFVVRLSTACSLDADPANTAGSCGVTLFPNPNAGAFTMYLSSEYSEEAYVTVSNAVGDKVNELTTTTNKQTPVNVHLAAGIYLLSVRTAHDIYTTRLTIQ